MNRLNKTVIIAAIGIICLFLTNGCHHGWVIIGDQPTYRKAPPPPPPPKAGPPTGPAATATFPPSFQD